MTDGRPAARRSLEGTEPGREVEARAQLFMGDGGPPPSTQLVLDAFDQQVSERATEVAVIDAGRLITYAELDDLAHAFGDHLRAAGAQVDKPVGVSMAKTWRQMAAFIGAWRAQAPFVVLDASFPARRLSTIVEEAQIAVVVTDQRPIKGLDGVRVINADAVTHRVPSVSQRRPEAGHPAYFLFTSGSTGTPKGVAISHGSLANLYPALLRAEALQAGDTVAWNGSPAFDVSLQQWPQVAYGHAVLIVDPLTRLDPDGLCRLLADYAVQMIDFTPSHLEAVLPALIRARVRRPLRLLVGGEAIGPVLWRRLQVAERAGLLTVINEYGPTECTVAVTCTSVLSSDQPSIGRPIPGTRLYVLDDSLGLVPVGEVGELCVAGVQVGLGYISQPVLTARSFLPDPFASGQVMYRTGDLVRWRNGQLDFVGRRDDQVKVRGFRIELADVEHGVRKIPELGRATAVAAPDADGDITLAVFYEGDRAWDPGVLMAQAAHHLPSYMLPTRWTHLDQLPTTHANKIDRRRLMAMLGSELRTDAGRAAPETDSAT